MPCLKEKEESEENGNDELTIDEAVNKILKLNEIHEKNEDINYILAF